MTPESLWQRIRLGEDSTLELKAVPDATLDDLDALLIRRFVQPEQGDWTLQLERLHLLTRRDGLLLPTYICARCGASENVRQSITVGPTPVTASSAERKRQAVS